MKLMSIFAAGLILVAATGCSQKSGPKETGGALIGAGLGGLAGSQIGSGSGQLAAVGLGVLLGGLLGSEVGRSLDKADKLYAARTTQAALEYNPVGERSDWRNPDSGNYGSITPIETYAEGSGQPCREFQQTVTIGGRSEEAYGTACRQEDGSWKIVNN